jgi:hypothetical protein
MDSESFDHLVTGIMANIQRMMNQPELRMPISNIKIGPPLGYNLPNLTFSEGDIDDILMNENDLFSGDVEPNKAAISQAVDMIKYLKSTRAKRREILRSRPDILKILIEFGELVIRAMAKVARRDTGFLHALYHELRSYHGSLRPYKQKGDDYHHINVNETLSALGREAMRNKAMSQSEGEGDLAYEGGIPVAVYSALAKAGKFIIDYGPWIYAAYQAISGDGASNDYVKSDVHYNTNLTSINEVIDKLTASSKSAGVGLNFTKYKKKFSDIPSGFVAAKYQTSNAAQWRQVYGRAMAKEVVRKYTMSLQGQLAKAYLDKNPDQPTVAKLMVPSRAVPTHRFMQSAWDPLIVQDEDVAWKDFVDYTEALFAVNPKAKGYLGNEGVSDLERKFKNGSAGLSLDVSTSDGWDDVSKAYALKTWGKQILAFLKELEQTAKASYEFSTQFEEGGVKITRNEMFTTSPESSFKPWDKDYMAGFNENLRRIRKEKQSSGSIVTPDNTVVENVSSNDNIVNTNTNVNTNVNTNQNNMIDPSSGAIIVTPHGTIVGSGNMTTNGKISDYSDLYELGKTIHEMQKKSRLMIDIPGMSAMGDIPTEEFGEGGFFGGLLKGALKIGKKLLSKTKIGKKIIGGATKLLSKVPILKSFIKKKPVDVASLAKNVIGKEMGNLKSLLNIKGVPGSPGGIMDLLKTVKSSVTLLQGISPKLDSILSALTSLELKTFGVGDILTGDIRTDIQIKDGFDPDAEYSIGDVLTAMTDPEAMLNSEDDDDFQGSIDLWRITQ